MMGLRHWVGVAALGLSLAALASGPVAFVADIHGNASIEGDGKVTFLAELKAGTRLMLGSGAKVSVTYASSGAEYRTGSRSFGSTFFSSSSRRFCSGSRITFWPASTITSNT